MGDCWIGWLDGSWLDGSWCPTTPPVPTPIRIGGGASGYVRRLKRLPPNLNEEAIALMLLLLDDDD